MAGVELEGRDPSAGDGVRDLDRDLDCRERGVESPPFVRLRLRLLSASALAALPCEYRIADLPIDA